MTFFHGIQIAEPVEGVRPILEKSSAVIGVVVTGPDADALAFPLDRPVLVTDVRSALAAAGEEGTLAKVLGAIADQGSPLTIVVRVAEGEADGELTAEEVTTANIIGSNTEAGFTGMQALLAAEAQLGIRPRILGVPGFDNQAVTTALVVVAKSLRGMAYAAVRPDTTIVETAAEAVLYRGEFAARELMLIWPDFKGWDGQAVGVALGLRAMLDETDGWHKSLSNVAVAGVAGLSRDIHFDIRDSSTVAGVLNAAQVTTLVRMTGYRFWGNRTCSDEPLFAFETATRSAQAVQDAIADGLTWAIDKPMTVGTVRDIVETINATLRRWVGQGRLIGGRCWFDPASNPRAQLAAGQLVLDYDFTSVAPLEGLQLNQRITDKYYVGFGDALTA